MRHVIVPPAVSYSVLALGMLISLAFVWESYRIAVEFKETATAQAAYYQVAP
jgi:hypothetical protein